MSCLKISPNNIKLFFIINEFTVKNIKPTKDSLFLTTYSAKWPRPNQISPGVPESSRDKLGWYNHWKCSVDWFELRIAYSYSHTPRECEQRQDLSASLNEETHFQGDYVLQAGWRLIYSMTSQIAQCIRLIQQLRELWRSLRKLL